jgi:hypothetical protein
MIVAEFVRARGQISPNLCLRTGFGEPATAPRCWEVDQTWSFRGSKSRNKVSVGEPAEGSLLNKLEQAVAGSPPRENVHACHLYLSNLCTYCRPEGVFRNYFRVGGLLCFFFLESAFPRIFQVYVIFTNL